MSRITKDWIETYFEYGVDVQNRRIFLIGDIEADTTRIAAQGLKLFESKNNSDPIEIFIGTPGGDVYSMFGLYDAILSCPCHVRTIAVGQVQSAGPLLLTAGDESLSYRNTYFMVHENWWDLGRATASTHENEVKHNKELTTRWGELMEQGTSTPSKKWIKMAKGDDYYFDATDAKDFGLIERII